jgi:hypothetical protein
MKSTTDLVYGGRSQKMQKFANSHKVMLLMRISHKVDVKALLQEWFPAVQFRV